MLPFWYPLWLCTAVSSWVLANYWWPSLSLWSVSHSRSSLYKGLKYFRESLSQWLLSVSYPTIHFPRPTHGCQFVHSFASRLHIYAMYPFLLTNSFLKAFAFIISIFVKSKTSPWVYRNLFEFCNLHHLHQKIVLIQISDANQHPIQFSLWCPVSTTIRRKNLFTFWRL